MRDGDLSGADGEGDEVSETVNGAVEAEVGHRGRSKGFDEGEYGFGFEYVGGS